MTERPECIIDGCHYLAQQHCRRKDGSYSYRKLCGSHHRKRYNMPLVNSAKRKKLGNTLNMERSVCALCGWDKAPCDRHRIKYGIAGGKYVMENILSVCPNCHRLIHMNLLKIK